MANETCSLFPNVGGAHQGEGPVQPAAPFQDLMSESGFILDVRRGLAHLSERSWLRQVPTGILAEGS